MLLKLRTEEMEDRVEPVIAGAVSRVRFFTSNVVLALATSTLYVVVAGAVIALLVANADIGLSFTDAFVQAVATTPAVWTVVALSAAVVGARPAASIAAWAGVLLSFGLTLLGPTFGLDDWALAISPFWHVPEITAASPDWTGLGWLPLVTAAFLAVGFTGFRKRDLAR